MFFNVQNASTDIIFFDQVGGIISQTVWLKENIHKIVLSQVYAKFNNK